MRAGKDQFPKKEAPSRPVCGWAGVSLSTYKKIKPWCKTEKTKDESSTSVLFGAAWIAFQLTAPNSIVNSIKNKVDKITCALPLITRRKSWIETTHNNTAPVHATSVAPITVNDDITAGRVKKLTSMSDLVADLNDAEVRH